MVTKSFQLYLNWILKQKKTEVKRVRMDNGGEYKGHEFTHICHELGIIQVTTSPHTLRT